MGCLCWFFFSKILTRNHLWNIIGWNFISRLCLPLPWKNSVPVWSSCQTDCQRNGEHQLVSLLIAHCMVLCAEFFSISWLSSQNWFLPKICVSIVLMIMHCKTNTFILFIIISLATSKFPNKRCLSYHCVLNVLFALILKSQVWLPTNKKSILAWKVRSFSQS